MINILSHNNHNPNITRIWINFIFMELYNSITVWFPDICLVISEKIILLYYVIGYMNIICIQYMYIVYIYVNPIIYSYYLILLNINQRRYDL